MEVTSSRVKRKRKSDNVDGPNLSKKLKSGVKTEATCKVVKKSKKITPNTVKIDEKNVIEQEESCNEIWREAEMLTFVERVPITLADSFINLLNEGCTLPFIARYRKEMIDHLMPDRLQELYDSYQSVCKLKKKVLSVIDILKKSNKLTPQLEKSILSARNLSEVDLVYAPLKTSSQSLAERARNLGLEPYAISALNGKYVDLKSEELLNVKDAETHITYIIADIIYKDPRVMEEMRKLKEITKFLVTSCRTKSSLKVKEDSEKKHDTKSDPDTYKLYFDWKCPTQFIKPHQTLAINRGEDEKILSIKVVVPDWYYSQLERFCLSCWSSGHWIKKGLGDAYNRLIKPWLSRQIRCDLTKLAEKEAVKTFTNNLEKYLMTEPIKNKRIAGLDPGFRAGCKVGIIDEDGKELEACAIYPNLRNNNAMDPAARQLKALITKHRVELIGLGNGTACRETESWLKYHNISTDVPVIIVPEQGASIYSISKEAQKEHPNMDPNLISALSIARRVLDPLGELIKVEPKNLGVGLYQHDIPPKMLDSALTCTVEKVVSLVGVDINTASLPLLRRIAGLNENRAKKIISYRQDKNGFKTREEILKVTGIGKITFQQCAGFLKVFCGPDTLDSTIIHPESYGIAKLFAKKIGVDTKDIVKPHFSQLVESKVSSIDIHSMSKELKTDIGTMELIIQAFKQKSIEDNVLTFSKPVYSIFVQATEHLQEGMTVIGVVRNVVPFGCFVDCGVGDNGLIHKSNMAGIHTPKLGDRVKVTILASPKPRKIQLRLVEVM